MLHVIYSDRCKRPFISGGGAANKLKHILRAYWAGDREEMGQLCRHYTNGDALWHLVVGDDGEARRRKRRHSEM